MTPPREGRIPLRAASCAYLIGAVGLALLNAGMALYLLFAPETANATALAEAAQMGYYLLAMLLPAGLLMRRHGVEGVRLKPIGFGATAAVCMLAILGMFLAQYLGALWSVALEGLGISSLSASAQSALPAGSSLVRTVLLLVVVPAICEEIAFRGVLLGALEALGTRRAVLISALLFALLHGTLVALPVHFLMGLMLGYLAFAYDSLYAAMAFHIVYNASIVFMAALSEPTAAAQEAIGAQSMFAALGGWSGVLWVAIYALALGLTLRACVRAVERRRRALGIAALPRAQKRIDAASAAMLGVCALFYALDLVAGMLLPALETLGAGA